MQLTCFNACIYVNAVFSNKVLTRAALGQYYSGSREASSSFTQVSPCLSCCNTYFLCIFFEDFFQEVSDEGLGFLSCDTAKHQYNRDTLQEAMSEFLHYLMAWLFLIII